MSCLDRNGEISYRTQAVRNGIVEGTAASVGGSARHATISGLSPSTVYTVQVVAVNGAGTGPYSSGISVRTSGKTGQYSSGISVRTSGKTGQYSSGTSVRTSGKFGEG